MPAGACLPRWRRGRHRTKFRVAGTPSNSSKSTHRSSIQTPSQVRSLAPHCNRRATQRRSPNQPRQGAHTACTARTMIYRVRAVRKIAHDNSLGWLAPPLQRSIVGLTMACMHACTRHALHTPDEASALGQATTTIIRQQRSARGAPHSAPRSEQSTGSAGAC